MDLSGISLHTLKQNRATYSRRLPDVRAEQQIAEVDAEISRRKERQSHRTPTAGYVLTATGQYEHIAGEREGFTKCGVAIDPTRQYGNREWWHCLLCGR